MSDDERILAGVEMSPIKWREPPAGLHATHQGRLRIGDEWLTCYQLSDGRRVIDSKDVKRLRGIAASDAG
jgi:hypothetical protein